MRPIFLFLLLAGVLILAWVFLARPGKKPETAKQEAIAVSKHSSGFNNSIAPVLADYNRLAENFVNWDSVASAATAKLLA